MNGVRSGTLGRSVKGGEGVSALSFSTRRFSRGGRPQRERTSLSVQNCLHEGCRAQFDHCKEMKKNLRKHMLKKHHECSSTCRGCQWVDEYTLVTLSFDDLQACQPRTRRTSAGEDSHVASVLQTSETPVEMGGEAGPQANSPYELIGRNALRLLEGMGHSNNVRIPLRGALIEGLSTRDCANVGIDRRRKSEAANQLLRVKEERGSPVYEVLFGLGVGRCRSVCVNELFEPHQSFWNLSGIGHLSRLEIRQLLRPEAQNADFVRSFSCWCYI